MKTTFWQNNKQIFVWILLSIYVCIPIWSQTYFLSHDGSAHIYTANIINQLLKGNEFYQNFFQFNSLFTPNASGHYLILVFLFFFSAPIVSKIMATITLLGLPFSITWFRYVTNGKDDLTLSFLIGLTIAFNSLWLTGFYNFLIGVIILIFTLGLFIKWRDNLNFLKYFIISILFILVYLSHLISFLILFGSIIILSSTIKKEKIKKTAIYLYLAILPTLLFLIIYFVTSQNKGGEFQPTWKNLENPHSILHWLSQIRSSDVFIIISRKTFPFTETYSNLFIIFTPILWIVLSVGILLVYTIYKQGFKQFFKKDNIPYIFLIVFSIFVAMFAPDSFGGSTGSVLRERILFCAFIFIIPVYISIKHNYINILVKGLLIFVIMFQTCATFEYALQNDRIAKSFFELKNTIKENESYAMITILQTSEPRFSSNPIPQMNNLNGVGKNILIWDNYEMGHFLFPIVAKDSEKRKIIFRFTNHNIFETEIEKINQINKFNEVNTILSDVSSDIDNIIVWGVNPEIESELNFISQSKVVVSNKDLKIYQLPK